MFPFTIFMNQFQFLSSRVRIRIRNTQRMMSVVVSFGERDVLLLLEVGRSGVAGVDVCSGLVVESGDLGE